MKPRIVETPAETPIPVRRRGRPTLEMQARLHDHILEAAWTVFAARGFGNSTVQQICTEAGISLATFYRQFTDKQDIFKIAMRQLEDVETASLSSIEAMDLEAGLLQAANTHLERVPGTRAQEAIRLIYAEAPRFPELAKHLSESSMGWLRILMRFLQKHRDGLSDAEAYDLAVLFMGMVGGRSEHEFLLCLPGLDEKRRRRHARLAVDVFLRGFATATK